MKNTLKKWIVLLSFLLLSACTTFPENQSTMGFTVSLPGGAIQLSGNDINVVASSTTTGKLNHHLLFHLISTDNAIPYGPWTESVPVTPIQNGTTATLDIHSLVDAEFRYNFSRVLNSSASKVYPRNQLAANFTIEIGETYIDENGDRFETDFDDPGAVIASTTLTVIKGGLSTAEYCILNEQGKSFYTNYIQKPRFLTRLPREVTLSRNSWLKLWFIKEFQGTMEIKMYIHYKGSSETDIKTYTQVYNAGYLYELNTNLDVWGTLLGTPSDYIIEIPLGNDELGAPVYNRFRINLDYDYNETVNDFYYVGSLGAVDLLHCTGELIAIPETAGETFVRRLPTSPSSLDATITQDRKKITRRWRCNTGNKLTIAQRDCLLEFLSTPYKWWITDKFGSIPGMATMIPIIVKPGSFQLDDSTGDPQDIEFEFEIANYDKF